MTIETKAKASKEAPKKAASNSLGAHKVEIRVLNPKRLGTLIVRSITDPETGDMIELRDRLGNETTYAITRPVQYLNLGDEFEAKVYEILQKHPVYVNTVYPLITIKDVIQEAETELHRIELEDEARVILRNLNSVQLADFARLFLGSTDTLKDTLIKTQMYKFVATSPQEVIDQWNAPDRQLRVLAQKARNRGKLRVNNGIWYYAQQPIGDSFEKAIFWLKDNEDLIPILTKEVESL